MNIRSTIENTTLFFEARTRLRDEKGRGGGVDVLMCNSIEYIVFFLSASDFDQNDRTNSQRKTVESWYYVRGAYLQTISNVRGAPATTQKNFKNFKIIRNNQCEHLDMSVLYIDTFYNLKLTYVHIS